MRLSGLAATLIILASVPVAFAQTPAQPPSPDEITCQLDPSCATGHVKRRSIDPSEVKAQPKQNAINLNVPFEFNSAVLQTDARITLDNLGKALTDPRLAGYSFLIGGHTDAKGSQSYNKVLSERRAKAVREYLMTNFSIPANRLKAEGFGSLQLLDGAHPEDGVNRRVQIVNTTASPPAQ
jgi:outer membrane protein OmpA-like peptidoglycan-associated protein